MLPFYLLDVFAEKRHEGNQLLVVVDEERVLDDARMLDITREINYAETAFVCGPAASGGGTAGGAPDAGGAATGAAPPIEANVRIFTPEYEVPFAGHPSLGLAHVIAHVVGLRGGEPDALVLRLAGGGAVPVSRGVGRGGGGGGGGGSGDVWWMQQPQPVFLEPLPVEQLARLVHPTTAALVDDAALAGIGGIGGGGGGGGRSVPHVSTGLPYLLVPVRGPAALAAVQMGAGGEAGAAVLEALRLHAATHPQKLTVSLYFYHRCTAAVAATAKAAAADQPAAAAAAAAAAREAAAPDISSRMFCFERGEWVEDAATGSAAGCMAAFLAQQLAGSTGQLRISQGVAMGRPSSLLIDASAPAQEGGEWSIRVGGRVVPIASGQWAT